MHSNMDAGRQRSSTLVDVLDRVLDKGLVVAGDIKVSLAEVELITIRVRLLICSVDKAESIGLDWWRHDRNLSVTGNTLALENEALTERVRQLESRLAASEAKSARKSGSGRSPGSASKPVEPKPRSQRNPSQRNPSQRNPSQRNPSQRNPGS